MRQVHENQGCCALFRLTPSSHTAAAAIADDEAAAAIGMMIAAAAAATCLPWLCYCDSTAGAADWVCVDGCSRGGLWRDVFKASEKFVTRRIRERFAAPPFPTAGTEKTEMSYRGRTSQALLLCTFCCLKHFYSVLHKDKIEAKKLFLLLQFV